MTTPITFGSAKSRRAYIIIKLECSPPVGHNVHVHSVHILVLFAFLSAFLGDFSGVDINGPI